MQKKYGETTEIKTVRSAVMDIKGGISAGSITTTLNTLETFPVKYLIESYRPFGLSPIRPSGRSVKQKSVLFDQRLGGWIGPWFMSTTNAAVVFRTYGLLGGKWGTKFFYKEYLNYGSWIKSQMVRLMLRICLLALTLPLFRWVVRKFAPGSGQGPTEEAMNNGKFTMKIIAETDEETPREGSVILSTNQDAAYLLTGIASSECAK